ncbi:hypothetical protein J6Q66_02695, partial [bacterium]|nr:hypothetical protein [bacterium]
MKKNVTKENKKFTKILACVCGIILGFVILLFTLINAFQPMLVNAEKVYYQKWLLNESIVASGQSFIVNGFILTEGEPVYFDRIDFGTVPASYMTVSYQNSVVANYYVDFSTSPSNTGIFIRFDNRLVTKTSVEGHSLRSFVFTDDDFASVLGDLFTDNFVANGVYEYDDGVQGIYNKTFYIKDALYLPAGAIFTNVGIECDILINGYSINDFHMGYNSYNGLVFSFSYYTEFGNPDTWQYSFYYYVDMDGT